MSLPPSITYSILSRSTTVSTRGASMSRNVYNTTTLRHCSRSLLPRDQTSGDLGSSRFNRSTAKAQYLKHEVLFSTLFLKCTLLIFILIKENSHFRNISIEVKSHGIIQNYIWLFIKRSCNIICIHVREYA